MEQNHIDRQLKLADALESGKYQQTFEVLRDDNGFCCLGVACDIFRKETGKGEWDNSFFSVNEKDRSNVNLPYFVRDWYGFEDSSPICSGINLIDANDDGETFPVIASYIREQLGNE